MDAIGLQAPDLARRGASEADVLASLGLPEDHVQGFLQDFELSQALGTRALPQMMAVAGQRIHRSLAAAGAVLTVLFLAVFAAGVVLTAVMTASCEVHCEGTTAGPLDLRQSPGKFQWPGRKSMKRGLPATVAASRLQYDS